MSLMYAKTPGCPCARYARTCESCRAKECARTSINHADRYLLADGLPGYLEVVGALQRLVLSLPAECQTEAREEAQGVLAQLRGRL